MRAEHLDESAPELPSEAWEALMKDHSGLQTHDHPDTWQNERWRAESQREKQRS